MSYTYIQEPVRAYLIREVGILVGDDTCKDQ